MGVYTYLTLKSKPVVAEHRGQAVTVYRRKYLCRAEDLEARLFEPPASRRRRALLNARTAAVENAWGEQRPKYVVQVSRDDGVVAEGDDVRVATAIVTDDAGPAFGLLVGHLRRVGKSWKVEPLDLGDSFMEDRHTTSCYVESVNNLERDTFWVCRPGCPVAAERARRARLQREQP